jgi:2-polyprenyl-6-methoxyphenol hydroxylase-like FAD-dependent oxidoreductase
MSTSNPPIAIIGAGPAGLTLASLLTLRSIPYTLFERSGPPSPSDNSRAGGSLDIHPETGQLALKEAGLFDEFQRFARYEDTVFNVFDKTGKKMLQMGQGRDAPEIDRGELTRVLLGGVPGERIKWECKLEKVVRAEDGMVELRFGNGEVRKGWRLVVGADGARSRVRGMVGFSSEAVQGR